MLDVRVDGKLLPKLTLAHCLWLKRKGDPDEYDPRRLRVLRIRRLPRPVRLRGQRSEP